ncbi:HPr family phosphocarrier protein [Chlamydia sp. 17-3921]|uniref:HPr family phosphocarrier protein n=1 Tax=Chlamydia sp. 17-3921 TaxID=2675798 RepID=UPI001918E127|nr:HPr family phosphocarrier protein [Chlamydia sp. 17-3921]
MTDKNIQHSLLYTDYENTDSTFENISERSVICTVRNLSGIHVRPAGTIVRLLDGEKCEVSFSFDKKTINAKSIMSILMLGAPQGGEVLVSVRGQDIQDVQRILEKLQNAFETGFGEL